MNLPLMISNPDSMEQLGRSAKADSALGLGKL